MLGEERVCGVGENKIDQNGSTDHKGDRHTKEDGQHAEPLGCLGFLLFHVFAFPTVHGAGTACLAGADSGFARCFGCAADNTVNGFIRVVLRVIFVFKADAGVAAERSNGIQHFLRGLVTVGGILFHGLLGDLAQPNRDIGGNLSQRLRLFTDLHDGDGNCPSTIKRQLAGQHLVHHNANRINISAGIGMVAFGLFRADVMNRADGLVADSLALCTGKACNAKVHHFDGAIRLQHNILWLHIAVNNALGVCMIQRAEHLCGKVDNLFPG